MIGERTVLWMQWHLSNVQLAMRQYPSAEKKVLTSSLLPGNGIFFFSFRAIFISLRWVIFTDHLRSRGLEVSYVNLNCGRNNLLSNVRQA